MSIAFFDKILSLFTSIVPFLVVLLIIVFVHELGHFLIARYNGVKVTTFSIGYGSELFGWTDKKGTRWRISALPIGGYVMMLGDADATSVKADLANVKEEDLGNTVHSKTPFQRMMISIGGPLFNVIFTIGLIIAISLVKGIPDIIPEIQEVLKGSVASKCGLQVGDVITGVGNHQITKLSEMSKHLNEFSGKDVIIRVKRNNNEKAVTAHLFEIENEKKVPISRLGIVLTGQMIYEKVSVSKAAIYAVNYCSVAFKSLIAGLVKTITRQKDGIKLGSIFSIGEGLNKSLDKGFISLLTFMAMLSFSLAFFNLLPIPVLDGGSIFLNFVEIVIRRPIPAVATNVIYFIGICLVGIMMVVALWNDVEKYGFFEKVASLINWFKK
ncbi:MAG: M50 family metallopeptidase [Holosporales bacterium]|jgi:regulator of sigma E protease|nr:M50 family metallopeptidase [Holosporales bacterium]